MEHPAARSISFPQTSHFAIFGHPLAAVFAIDNAQPGTAVPIHMDGAEGVHRPYSPPAAGSELLIERIVHVLRYLPWGYLLVLSAVHLAGALAAAVWVVRAVIKQVFPLSGKQSDLPLEEEEAAV